MPRRQLGYRPLPIGIERIEPGHPQQNGRHERMHLTLKRETAKPAALNFLLQQARPDDFIEIFNKRNVLTALAMKCPAEVHQPSLRPYKGWPDIDYPFHDKAIVVTRCGRICLGREKISMVFAGQAVASRRFTMISGCLAFGIMIWDTSIWIRACWNRLKIRSAQSCRPCRNLPGHFFPPN
jgi:hypothetical protein